MKNKIAVIMCVYKGDTLSFLKETLLSLYQQTFNNFDIHIQCDGKLPMVLDEYLESELLSKRIFLLNRRDANIGFPASLNELLKNALNMDYEYFVRMDADDICDDSRIEKQFLFMERSDNIDVVGSDILEFYDDGSQKLIHYRSKHEQIKSDFSTRTAIPHVTAFFRRSFFDKAGLYNIHSNKNEDQWLWLSGFVHGCIFASIPLPLVKVRLSFSLLNRRRDFRHNLDTLYLRNHIIATLGFSKLFYLRNIVIFFVKLLPVKILQIAYKYRHHG